jgi:hypothetical protein
MDLSDQSGPIATWADNNSEIRNCIVNLRFAEGSTVLPKNQGSIVGKAGGWTGYVKNSYAIVNNTGVERICANENGTVAASTMSTSAQFETYALLKAGADLSMYDSNIWSFGENSISFGGVVVLEVVAEPEVPVDEYTHIKTAEEWYTLITLNPAGKYKLDNDIDLAGGFLVKDGAPYATETFTGVLDGCGFAVKNAWLSGGWNNGLFRYQAGTVKNIAFINMQSADVVYETALFAFNRGTIENVYLDMVIWPARDQGGSGAGTLVGGAEANCLIKNCVVNVRKSAADTVVSGYGAIVGKIYSWSSIIQNSYAITNDTGLTSIAFAEADTGIIDWTVNTNKSNVFQTYAEAVAGADISMFDSNIWSFTETSISFGGKVVYSVQ